MILTPSLSSTRFHLSSYRIATSIPFITAVCYHTDETISSSTALLFGAFSFDLKDSHLRPSLAPYSYCSISPAHMGIVVDQLFIYIANNVHSTWFYFLKHNG